jgi:hypothetical protein
MSIDKPSISSEKKLGIIAGQGELPGAIVLEAKKMGYSVTAILLRPFADESIKEYTDSFYEIPIGRFGKIIKFLKQSSISEIVIAGKVPKGILFQDKKSLMPDLRAIRFLLSLKDYSDTTLLQAISNELKNDGIKILKTTTFTKDLLTTEGVLTKRHPRKDQYRDIRFGWRIAKEIGRLDIGQTIVVKDMAVMAVEAMEGTDEAILRGGRLAKKDSVVIKVSKPHQDLRFDVPVVGIHTLSIMKRVNASLLVLEAEKSIILEKEKFIKEADKAGIIVVGVK